MNNLYNTAIRLYGLAARISAPAVPKAREWVKGRKQWRQKLKAVLPQDGPVLWVHCASLGEFEQGRPVIERIKREWPNSYLLLTFFSPSGYDVRKNYEHADLVTYMPLDTPRNARDFVSIVQPDLAIFVKYEFWLNHLNALYRSEIPVLLISALFRRSQPFFKKLGSNFRRALHGYAHIFVQDEHSAELLRELDVTNVTISGDNRIDRVLELADKAEPLKDLEAFSKDAPVFVFGSIWQQDEMIFRTFIRDHLEEFRFVVAPHETSRPTVDRYCSIFENHFIKLSEFRKYDPNRHRVLIVDSVGKLSSIYQYAEYAYIGGAFGHGLHNILEPIAFRIPVFFGPRFDNFLEAIQLAELEAAFPVRSYEEFLEKWEETRNKENTAIISDKLKNWLDRSKGATDRVMSYIRESGILKTIRSHEEE